MRLKLTSTQQSIQKIEHILRSLLELYDVAHERFPEILVATTEAVNNAIAHGNNCDTNKFVYLETKVNGSIMSIQIEDQGCGFCEQEVADPTEKDRIHQQGGRGLLVMRQLSDEIEFHKNGRIVELRFSIGRR